MQNIKNGIVDNSTNQYIDNDDISIITKDTPTTDFHCLFILNISNHNLLLFN